MAGGEAPKNLGEYLRMLEENPLRAVMIALEYERLLEQARIEGEEGRGARIQLAMREASGIPYETIAKMVRERRRGEREETREEPEPEPTPSGVFYERAETVGTTAPRVAPSLPFETVGITEADERFRLEGVEKELRKFRGEE